MKNPLLVVSLVLLFCFTFSCQNKAEKDPFLANIRREPRFKKLMERVKCAWEHFEV